MRRIVLFALLALLAATPLTAQVRSDAPDPTTLAGVVVDQRTGAPLPGAVVYLVDDGRIAITDDAGRFSFSRVVPGDVMLTAEQLGYVDITETRQVAPDTPIRIELEPQPVVLEGLTVMADRLESRRRAAGTTARALVRGDFATLGSMDLLEAIRIRGRLNVVRCGQTGARCVYRRGRAISPRVWLDEERVSMGLDDLAFFGSSEVYAVEIYGEGRAIRVYTRDFMRRAALNPYPLPILGY